MNQLLVALCILITTSSCMLHIVSCLKTTLDINTDMSALLTLKSQLTILPSNYNYSILSTNWSGDSDACSWIGVSCSARHRRVTRLNLSYKGLGGVLSPHLGNLSFLTYINLRENNFHGSIPSELFLLRRLEFAHFGGNHFSGHIPSNAFSARSLLMLSLRDNQFTGPVPSNLFAAPSLRVVALGKNFLSGSVPTGGRGVANTTSSSSLEKIGLESNNLTGELPGEIFHHLPNLNVFTVSNNMLSGPIPSSLGRCRLLQALSLSFNDFEGSIPPQIGNLTVLTELYLNDNVLTGAIPSEVASLINSEYLNLMNNGLTGEIPSCQKKSGVFLASKIMQQQEQRIVPRTVPEGRATVQEGSCLRHSIISVF